jgi:hypothetical protein
VADEAVLNTVNREKKNPKNPPVDFDTGYTIFEPNADNIDNICWSENN